MRVVVVDIIGCADPLCVCELFYPNPPGPGARDETRTTTQEWEEYQVLRSIKVMSTVSYDDVV